jgi:hypothetical protein
MPGLDKISIQELIACEKKIIDPPKKDPTLKNRSFRNDMKVCSIDGINSFSVFLRYSEDFQEDFSIGLVYLSNEGKIYTIFRCNGPHGESVSDFLTETPHYGHHIHTILPETANSMESALTAEYGTYQDAIAYFIKKCNIIGAEQYFSFLKKSGLIQQELGFDNE